MRFYNLAVASWFYTLGFLWFKIFGLGLIVKDTNRFPMTFSERMGFKKKIKIGRWMVRITI